MDLLYSVAAEVCPCFFYGLMESDRTAGIFNHKRFKAGEARIYG